jgi:hypothetical protein
MGQRHNAPVLLQHGDIELWHTQWHSGIAIESATRIDHHGSGTHGVRCIIFAGFRTGHENGDIDPGKRVFTEQAYHGTAAAKLYARAFGTMRAQQGQLAEWKIPFIEEL